MKRPFWFLSILLFLVFLFSCQDIGLFGNEEGNAEIITLEEGIILKPDDEIPIEILFENETPSSFSITLLDNEDSVRGAVTLEEEELAAEIPPLGLPEDLEERFLQAESRAFQRRRGYYQQDPSFFSV